MLNFDINCAFHSPLTVIHHARLVRKVTFFSHKFGILDFLKYNIPFSYHALLGHFDFLVLLRAKPANVCVCFIGQVAEANNKLHFRLDATSGRTSSFNEVMRKHSSEKHLEQQSQPAETPGTTQKAAGNSWFACFSCCSLGC